MAAAEESAFEKEIEPLLRKHCYRCHAGQNEEAGLLLDRAAGLLGTADSDEPIIVPGNADASLLMHRLGDEDYGDLMPLDGEPLPATAQSAIRAWVDSGAEFPKNWKASEHWAYAKPQQVTPPSFSERRNGLNSVDAFIAARLAEEGLTLASPAPSDVLARRVSLALTGLPATREQVLRLRNDSSDANYEALVDELLGSPAFGQHWARHWLDLARYADSNGFQADQLRDAWAYRDWVVDAFTNDLPFDQFVTEQLAGDLLPNANLQTRIATGFHRTPTCNIEAGVHPEANRVNQVFDRVNTTATVFLGSTLECAQCHDHKYDPFTQEDYYRLFAFFNNTPIEVEKVAGVQFDFVGPKMDLPMDEKQAKQTSALRNELEQLRKRQAAELAKDDFESWRTRTQQSLAAGRSEWITPTPEFGSSDNAPFRILDDGSVLIEGGLPKTVSYTFRYNQTLFESKWPILAVRLDALRDPSLPGGGPGRGDPERTNFVLHECDVNVVSTQETRSVDLCNASASFSQANYDVGKAIDDDQKTGWAIAPQFTDSHWAEFQLTEPIQIQPGESLTVTLQQNYGRGRITGRPKISFLVGPEESAGITDEIAELLLREAPLKPGELKTLRDLHRSRNTVVTKLDQSIKKTEKKLDEIKPPSTLVMVEMEQPRKTFVMERGDYLAPGQPVSPGTPSSLHPFDDAWPKNRLGLAKWITDRNNPLLARVTVNRFWMHVFGKGIVATPEDFGTQADMPSHPELLDWLANDFQNHRSVKQLLKTLVMSATFRQTSRVSDELLALDPDNRLLGRGARFRMPAEMIRDNALRIAGLLSEASGGEPVMPYQPDGIWKAVGRGQPKWKAAEDERRFRRGLYVVWKRGAPYPSFVTFDAPDRASCTVGRPTTNTPLQALVLLNDRVYAEASLALASRMIRECDSQNPRDVAALGYELACARSASDPTLDVLVQIYLDEKQRLADSPQDIEARLELLPKVFRDTESPAIELAAWFAVASTLLNLDVTITQN